MNQKRQQLQANEDTLNDKWVKILWAEQDLEERHRSVPKSYPHRRLLPKFDEELTNDVPLTRGWADQPDRTPRGCGRPSRESLHTQIAPRYNGKDPVDYLEPHDASVHLRIKKARTHGTRRLRGLVRQKR